MQNIRIAISSTFPDIYGILLNMLGALLQKLGALFKKYA